MVDRCAPYLPVLGRKFRLRRVARNTGLTRTEAGREIYPKVRTSRTAVGHRLTIRPVAGTGVESYEGIQDQLRSAYGVERVRVSRDDRQRAVVDLVTTDVLSETREVRSVADVAPAYDLDGITVGWVETGEPWSVATTRGSMVVGGVPDAGKSSFVSALLSMLAYRQDVQLVGIDLKDMVELSDWIPRFAATAGDQDELVDSLIDLERLRSRRMELLREEGTTSAKRHGFSAEFPLLLVVMDEAAEAFAPTGPSQEEKKRAARIVSLTSRLVRLGRAAGVFLLLATQKPTADAIPTLIRDAAVIKIALRVVTDEQTRAILADTRSGADADPALIGGGRNGVAVADTGSGYQYVRSFFVSEDVRREIASSTANLAKPLRSLIPEL